MTVKCKVGTHITVVDSKADCATLRGTVVEEKEPAPKACGVKTIFAHAMGAAIVDVGSATAATRGVIDSLTVRGGGARRPSRPGRLAVVKLTSARRRAVAGRAAGSLLNLARTYQTTLDFRDHVLLTTARGRRFKALYDRHLDEIIRVTFADSRLLHAAATTWLACHPFATAMIATARGRAGRRARPPVLTARMHRRCEDLVRGFRRASSDARFREALRQVERELKRYRGLDAAEALERLRRPGR